MKLGRVINFICSARVILAAAITAHKMNRLELAHSIKAFQ
jgi:hypothetical protein